MPAKSFQERIYEVYRHDEYKTGGSELRLMAWVVDDVEKPARVERRDYFLDSDGNRKNGKAKGLTYEDITFIIQHGKEIQDKMLGIKAGSKNTVDKETHQKNDVPFA